jgi:hypothetical protein
MQSYNKFVCPIVEDDDGELCIEFSDELLKTLDLKVGDMLEWEPSLNNTWILKKIGVKNEEG